MQPYTLDIEDIALAINPVNMTVCLGRGTDSIALNIIGGKPVTLAVAKQATHDTVTVVGTNITLILRL